MVETRLICIQNDKKVRVVFFFFKEVVPFGQLGQGQVKSLNLLPKAAGKHGSCLPFSTGGVL